MRRWPRAPHRTSRLSAFLTILSRSKTGCQVLLQGGKQPALCELLGDHERAYLMTLSWYDVGKACRMSGGIASFLRLLSGQARGYLVEEGVPSCATTRFIGSTTSAERPGSWVFESLDAHR